MPTTINEAQPPLLRKNLEAQPMQQFKNWYDEAEKREVPDQEAFSLSSVSPDQIVSSRMLLLRGLDDEGFVFYTNYSSLKSSDIEANPNVSMLFFWPTIYRQVRIQGAARKIPHEESMVYFRSRPRESQIGAWASKQSSVVENREALWTLYKNLENAYDGNPVPEPDFWGGYHVEPVMMEFWQGQPSRMHDRFNYTLEGKTWKIDRLSP